MPLYTMNLENYIYGTIPSFMATLYSVSEAGVSEPTTEKIWKIVGDIAGGLEFIHRHGEVHRDLKPRNGIFL